MSPSRRRFIAAMSAAGAAGVAGCIGGEEGEEEDDDGTDSSGGSESDDDTPEPDAEPVTDTITVRTSRLPDQFELNQWAASPDYGGFNLWCTEMMNPFEAGTNNRFFSGHTWEIDGREVSVPVLAKDREINPPYEVTFELDDRLTYWDGTPMDAHALELHHKLHHYHGGGHIGEDATEHKWGQALSDYEILMESNEDDPHSRIDFERWVEPDYEGPWHPDFTSEWVEKYAEVTTEEEHAEIAEELSGVTQNVYDWTENGWGSGPYRIESVDDIGEQNAIAHVRDDHPGKENINIPKLQIEFAEDDRFDFLVTQGEIDIFNDILQEEGGLFNRQNLPDHFQEIDSWPNDGGDQLLFNWNNKHLARLDVRRAIQAVVPWQHVGANGWGPEKSMPIDYDTFMHNGTSEEWFEEDFLDSLYDYPVEADEELATEFMENAGYTKEDGVWVDQEGDALELDFINVTDINEWITATQTIHEALQSFGIRSNLMNMEWPSWEDRLSNMNFDLSILWSPGDHPMTGYESLEPWWHGPLLYGNGDEWRCNPELEEGETDNQNRPLWTSVPEEVGELYIEGEDYSQEAQNQYVRDNGELLHICGNVRNIRKPEATREDVEQISRECARWYNYGLPDYLFHEYLLGITGNVRDFDWAPRGHTANKLHVQFGNQNYQILAGIVQASYDTDYPEP